MVHILIINQSIRILRKKQWSSDIQLPPRTYEEEDSLEDTFENWKIYKRG